MNIQDITRKTFNVYLDLELVKLFDLWAYRSGTSRSQLIERALADCMPDRPNEGHSRLGCPHVDLGARWNDLQENRSRVDGTSIPLTRILGEEYTPEEAP